MKFSSFFRKNPTLDRAERLYEQLAAQARKQEFYTELQVPDTVDGRFDMLVLHGFLVMRRFKVEGDRAQDLSQAVFDTLFQHMDISLREMGVGDLSVGKRIRKMATAFYGRVEAYDTPTVQGDRTGLAEALKRNLYRGCNVDDEAVLNMADYVLRAHQVLLAQDWSDLEGATLSFVSPESVSSASVEERPQHA